ncbi:glycoside hydrolase family 2 protein [Microbacterium sp. TS-1]|uniref:glycoside hydrolase family 2 protein n=1 Tax=Microbacterium sp. TS-1 TaxID=1344956 RepID=UPI0009DF27A4|nr:sugar-binding domain-containing protein [Microbacterium sp. TS-1]
MPAEGVNAVEQDAGREPDTVRASTLEPARPRPQLVRDSFLLLDGEWGFAHDDDDRGVAERWFDGRDLAGSILVPFPPESPASGVGETGFHPIVWYRRTLTDADLAAAGHRSEQRAIVRFGAVDYRATVWVDGQMVGSHEGGHTPFAVDITDALDGDAREHVIVVRAEDDPHDLAQPRGKQDWEEQPHSIWYHRTTGIWQSVWLESVAPQHITALNWTNDLTDGTVTLELRLSRPACASASVRIAHEGRELAAATMRTSGTRATLTIALDGQRNGQNYERLLWSPDRPTLLDAWIELTDDGGRTDAVASYLGLRSVSWSDGALLLNDRPVTLRSVLSQGYWPESHLAAPSPDALRREAELIAELGFNSVRVHQKVEDDRFLYWADRLGLLVWGEMAATYTFDERAVQRTTAEWTEAVLRDRAHPSIITWVPLNESWGVQHIASRSDQRAFAEALFHLTKALDPTRPVISNDGWELGTSDLWTLHDYEADGGILARRYDVDAVELRKLVSGIGPAGRRVRLPGTADSGQPVMLTEFGGVKWAADASPDDSWGYSEARGAEEYGRMVAAILRAVQSGTRGFTGRPDGLAGWCWTQLTDTMQERNGLLTEARKPKLPVETIRSLVQGTDTD